MRAYCLIRTAPAYRRDAFLQGLAAAGLNVSNSLPRAPAPEDVLVIWNRYGDNEALAARFEAGGGRVIVAENAYLGMGGRSHRPQDASGLRMYALSLRDHNGRGAWPAGSERFARLGVELKAWREGGDKILVCAQRGIGSPGRASPYGWADKVGGEIRKQLGGRVIVRPHPGENEPAVPLEQDLAGASACVIWASAAGVKALIEGIPVFYACPWWICAPGARRYQGPQSLACPIKNDLQRLAALERMSWGQWTVDEITSGEPFRRLLELAYPRTDAVPA